MDWTVILKELRDCGVTQMQVAEQCGVGQSAVSSLARGDTKSPGFDFGSKLLSLHRERCGAAERTAA